MMLLGCQWRGNPCHMQQMSRVFLESTAAAMIPVFSACCLYQISSFSCGYNHHYRSYHQDITSLLQDENLPSIFHLFLSSSSSSPSFAAFIILLYSSLAHDLLVLEGIFLSLLLDGLHLKETGSAWLGGLVNETVSYSKNFKHEGSIKVPLATKLKQHPAHATPP